MVKIRLTRRRVGVIHAPEAKFMETAMLSTAKAKGLLTQTGEALKSALSTILGTARRIGAATAESQFEFAADLVTLIGFVGASWGEFWLYESLPKPL